MPQFMSHLRQRSTMALIVMLIVIFAGASAAQAAGIGAAAHPFPDSSSKILIFTDQLPTQLSEAQWRFVATHYVGTQKMPQSWTRHIRRLNPHFIVLHYQLALGNGPAKFMVGNHWVNDFQSVSTHEDWFLHDDHGQRLHQKRWNWYVMNILFDHGKPVSGYPDYWLHTAVERMRANEDDGTFADSYTQSILMNQITPAYAWFTNVRAMREHWLPALNAFGVFWATGFHAQPEHFYYLPNLGGLVTTWDHTTKFDVGDGGMIEGFCVPSPNHFLSLADWKLSQTRILHLAAEKKILLCQTYINPDLGDQRWFIVGSFLLTKGPRSYLNMFHKKSLEWYPEYTVALGRYNATPRPNIADYWDHRWSIYRRDYAHGLVLVNPATHAVSIADLGGRYLLVSAHGGGAIDIHGDVPGTLATRAVTAVTIPAHSARVLLRPSP